MLVAVAMDDSLEKRELSVGDAERGLAAAVGTLLLIVGFSRRSLGGACLAVSAAPLLYKGVTGRWPAALEGLHSPDTRLALAGARGVHVRESMRFECPAEQVYGVWRRLEELPRLLSHLTRVRETTPGRSRWLAAGPAGLRVEWEAEIVNDIENRLLAWRSLPGGDVVTAGSVRFEPVRGGRSTQVSVHLQYAPPAGKAGAFLASLFGREPAQTIREDLRHFKQLLEAGEIPKATAA